MRTSPADSRCFIQSPQPRQGSSCAREHTNGRNKEKITMGQCALVAPPDSVKRRAEASSSTNATTDEIYAVADREFLKKHRPDQNQIVDSHHVNSLLDNRDDQRPCQRDKLFPTKSNAEVNTPGAVHFSPTSEMTEEIENDSISFVAADTFDELFITPLQAKDPWFEMPRPESFRREKQKIISIKRKPDDHKISTKQWEQSPDEQTTETEEKANVPKKISPPSPSFVCQMGRFRNGDRSVEENPIQKSPYLRLKLEAKFLEFYCGEFLQRQNPKKSDVYQATHKARKPKSGVEFADLPSSTQVRFVNGDPFLDLAVAGSLGLLDQSRLSQEKGMANVQKYKCLDHYIILMSHTSGVPIAVCALKTQLGLPVARIYCTKRRVAGQRRAALTSKLGFHWTYAFPLYPWAEVKTNGIYPMPFNFSIYMATGADGTFEETPSYRATSNIFTACPEIRVIGQSDSEETSSGCAILKAHQDDDVSYPSLELSIARGVDPGLFICFAAVVDEIMERSLRQSCKEK